jgi:hypothetical protein
VLLFSYVPKISSCDPHTTAHFFAHPNKKPWNFEGEIPVKLVRRSTYHAIQ